MSTTVAVIGGATPIGRAVLAALAGDPSFDRVIAVGSQGPPMPPGRVEVRTIDARDRLLPLALDGVDAVVHCAFSDDPTASPDALYGSNVGGTRNVLAAADAAGVRHVVAVSDAVVYGAHPDNPLPLREDAPLRANPGFAYAHQRQLAEDLVTAWGEAHPDALVTRLRHAPLLDGDPRAGLVARLQAPRLVVPAGSGAPWQFVATEDVAAAALLALREGLAGAFNVAADGWLSADEVATHLGRAVLEVPQATLEQALRVGLRLGVATAPPEVMPYLLHPWVLDTDALRRRGWQATRSNRELIAAFAAETADVLAFGRLQVQRAALRRAALGGAVAIALAVRQVRRLRRR